MEDKKDYQIFDGKTLSGLFKDIYNNSDKTAHQVNKLVDQLRKYISSLDNAIVVVPLIREYLDVKVKSDEHLVKLADTIQRLLRNEKSSDDNGLILSDEEKKQLLQEVPDYDQIRQQSDKKLDDLDKKVDDIKIELEEKNNKQLKDLDNGLQDRQK